MKRALSILLVLAGLPATAAADSIRGGRCSLPALGIALGAISSLNATPSTISFNATNPVAGVVPGSSAAAVKWTVIGGSHLLSWGISVQASAPSFSGCPTVPVTAVTAACASATVGGGAGTGSCGGSFTLSTTATQLAGGLEGDGTQLYSVLVQYTLAESWRYAANPSCTLTLTYTVNAP